MIIYDVFVRLTMESTENDFSWKLNIWNLNYKRLEALIVQPYNIHVANKTTLTDYR